MTNLKNLEFKKTILSNGLTVYSQLDPSVEFAHVSLITPVGSFHNHGDIIPGSFHFLEHLLASRSQKNPELRSGMLQISLFGGNMNARTSPAQTSYDVQIPTTYFKEGFDILMSHFFEPCISNENVNDEKGIITNERKRKECFYPGTSECSQYAYTQWMKDIIYSTDQIFGSDNDFEKMNSDYFHRLHDSYYKTTATYCVVAGNFDLDLVCNNLDAIQLTKCFKPLERKTDQFMWNNREFHSFESREASCFEYHLGWLYQTNGGFDDIYHGFMNKSIYQILASPSYGELFNWLRNEKQWSYGLKPRGYTVWGTSRNGLITPVNSMDQILEIRHEIKDRMYKGLSNTETLDKFKKQIKGMEVFEYQTVKQRIDIAMSHLHTCGEILTQQVRLQMLNELSTDTLKNYFESNIKNNMGEMVFVPKK